jgi:hypothetical protein
MESSECHFFKKEESKINFANEIQAVLTPIKQEYSFKFRLLIKRLIFSLKLDVYLYSIFP